MNLKEQILKRFSEGACNFKTEKEIFNILGLKKRLEKEECIKALNGLIADGEILLNKKRQYVLSADLGAKRGVLSGNERGFAFFIPDDKSGDLFIPPAGLNGGMHGDAVLCNKVTGKRGSTDEGEVLTILERGERKLVGTYEKRLNFGFVVPDDRRYFRDVYVPFAKIKPKNGDKVVVRIISYPEDRKNPEGEITEIIGNSKDKDIMQLSLIKSYDLPLEFPVKVKEAAKKVPENVSKEALSGRKDFRELYTITIDGEDAKDLDDGISIEEKKGIFKLYVHIADVSEYVKPNSAIDREALSRGTSVYFPNMVLPMLPEELSNGICSLNEREDRLTLTCIMEIDSNGKVLNSEIVKGVISSDRRMTYTAVTKILDGDKETIESYPDAVRPAESMRRLAQILIDKRKRRGTVDLDVKEAKITDDGGRIEVLLNERTIAHRIIEEFMIAANEAVAEFAAKQSLPFVYRIHDKPSEEKLNDFMKFIGGLGITMKVKEGDISPSDYQTVLNKLEGSPLFFVVNRVMLRSMQKAKYYPKNMGHFGLASKYYCHFTSPIRRYPDLLIHRIIKLVLDGRADEIKTFNEYVYEAAGISSEREKRAELAERDMDDLYKVKYMSEFLGEEFDAVISGVTGFGIFAELKNTCEGLIRLENLPDDDYVFEEGRYLLKGRKHFFKLGDAVRIRVERADLEDRKLEFSLII